MSTTLLLLCAAATQSDRTASFSNPQEGLDDGGRRAASRCRIEPRFRQHVLVSPSRPAVETALEMGLDGRAEMALRNIDHGNWTGRTLEDLHRQAPDALAMWLGDPTQAAPGGETMLAVQARIGAWLNQLCSTGETLVAITHQMTIRAALAHALDLPLASTLAIDVAPLSTARLSFNGRWRLQALGPSQG